MSQKEQVTTVETKQDPKLEKKKEAKLKYWRCAQICGNEVLVGQVYNHPRLDDGDSIRTSKIVRWIDENTVETLNTIYHLSEAEQ